MQAARTDSEPVDPSGRGVQNGTSPGPLPRSAPTQKPSQPMKYRVLVVDDSADAATMLSMIVGMLGNEVRTAGDGEQAIQVAGEFRPHLIFMDIGMPRMNGFDAAR